MDFLSDSLTQIILAPIVALLIPILWNFASMPISFLRELAMKTPSDVSLSFDINAPCLKNADFKCLLVRYGTDEYIKSMANDQEKYDGRLRNQIIDCAFEDGHLSFSIPVHKRIGTQFKCFMEVSSREEAQMIIDAQENFKNIYDLSFSSSQHKNRIFFMLKDYGETTTVDGLKNNMIFPI